jgi:hypothetical protein
LGGAASVWLDASAALDLFTPDCIAAVNDIGARWSQPIDLWCTLHHERMKDWREERATRGYPRASLHIGCEEAPGIDSVEDYRWPGMNASGSSGLFAVKCLMDRGFEEIVLAGVPMAAASAHFFDAKPWNEVDAFTQAWREQLPRLQGKVKSMSGATRDWLGAPTSQWLGAAASF